MASGYRPQSKDRSSFKERNTGDGGLSQLRQRDAQVVQGMQTEEAAKAFGILTDNESTNIK